MADRQRTRDLLAQVAEDVPDSSDDCFRCGLDITMRCRCWSTADFYAVDAAGRCVPLPPDDVLDPPTEVTMSDASGWG